MKNFFKNIKHQTSNIFFKSLKLSLLCLLLLVGYGCEEDPEITRTSEDYDQILLEYEGLQSAILGDNFISTSISSLNTSKENTVLLRFESAKTFENNQFIIKENSTFGVGNISTVPYRVDDFFIEEPNHRIGDVVQGMLDSTSIYSPVQKQMLISFSSEMLSTEDLLEVIQMTDSFKEDVINSQLLSEEERFELLLLGNSVYSLIDFIENGGIESMNNDLESLITEGDEKANGRIKGCSVNTRAVFSGAVVGFFGGAIRGAYVGGLHGAVIGAAAGFAFGAGYGVVSQLLQTCFRFEQPIDCNSLNNLNGGIPINSCLDPASEYNLRDYYYY